MNQIKKFMQQKNHGMLLEAEIKEIEKTGFVKKITFLSVKKQQICTIRLLDDSLFDIIVV
jgi:hypothetical protein